MFSPAEVKRVIPVGEKKIVVIISEENLAQAIGKEGQNIRLASKMLEKEIDVYGDEEFAAFTEEKRNAIFAGLPRQSAAAEEDKRISGRAKRSEAAGHEVLRSGPRRDPGGRGRWSWRVETSPPSRRSVEE